MAATIEVVTDNVSVKYRGHVLGKGQGKYQLRDFDPALDLYAHETFDGCVSSIVLELGDSSGRVTIRTRKHDTSIDIEVTKIFPNVGGLIGGSSGGIIFDETYGYGSPRPVLIIDGSENILAIVTHEELGSLLERA
jgi:hypothetical protein